MVISFLFIKISSGYSYNEFVGIAWFEVRFWYIFFISGLVLAIGRFRLEDIYFLKFFCNIFFMMFFNLVNWELRCL